MACLSGDCAIQCFSKRKFKRLNALSPLLQRGKRCIVLSLKGDKGFQMIGEFLLMRGMGLSQSPALIAKTQIHFGHRAIPDALQQLRHGIRKRIRDRNARRCGHSSPLMPALHGSRDCGETAAAQALTHSLLGGPCPFAI